MRTHPDTKIQIIGNNSNQPAINEVKDVSGKRGQVVYDYLINIWKIDPSRITLLPPRDLPEAQSNINDPLGIVENRRTEIRSGDWEIVKPIVNIDFRRTPQPDTMHFIMKNGINDALIARRAIEIKRNGQPWYTMTDLGKTEAVSPAYNWGRDANPDSIPNNETPYTAQLVVYSQDGKECRSVEIQIPVEIVTSQEKRTERLVDSTKDIYSLVLFKFNSPEAGPLNDRILREYIYNDVRPGARIEVIGHTDVVGLEDRNAKLSGDRAGTVVNGIRKNVKSGVYAYLNGRGVGENDPLYPNDLPEGRFYNRTVQVRIATPTGTSAGE
jgi:outer membrane protein OmpA-like peptidoglycan-associated protein